MQYHITTATVSGKINEFKKAIQKDKNCQAKTIDG